MNKPLESMMQQQLVWQGKHWHPSHQALTSTGYAQLDQQLQDQGWSNGSINEIYSSSMGMGEMQLVLPALAHLSEQKRWMIWIAPPAMPNATALQQHGINTERVLVVHPHNVRDQFWAIEQALRSGSCSAVLGWPQGLSGLQLRRLKVAAQSGDCIAFLFRPEHERSQASCANNRIALQGTANAGHFQAELFKRDGGWPVTLDDCAYQKPWFYSTH